MSQPRHTVDQIIAKLRRADVEPGKGKTVPDACKVLGISEQTYYRWRQQYGGMQPEMAQELKALQKENFAPILTSFSRSVVSDQCFTSRGKASRRRKLARL